MNTWTDLNKVTLYYQCFTLSVTIAKTANPQRATGVRNLLTITSQTRDDMEWLLGSEILLEKISTIFSLFRVSLNIPW